MEPNKNAFTPNFISAALGNITHRFLLVLECETRQYDPSIAGAAAKQKYTPARFTISGPRVMEDPRNLPVTELVPLTKNKPLVVPAGWEKLHQYIYLLQNNTDEHGWQYRSDWSTGVLDGLDEQWVPHNSDGLDVRRRMWFITVCKKDDIQNAKMILSEAVRKHPRGIIMRGDLTRYEQGTLMNSWVKRHTVLKDDRLEFYTNDKMEKRLSEFYIKGSECKMLFGSQCPTRNLAFSVRNNDGSIGILLDADNREVRRRWVVAISYQLAILSPDLNFSPFDYGPPTGDDAMDRVLTCGELAKQGHMRKNWKSRFFKLTPKALLYFEKESLKGSISIIGASLETDASSLEFKVSSADGHELVMRAESAKTKEHWVRTIQEQLRDQEDRQRVAAIIEAEEAQLAEADAAQGVEEEVKERASVFEPVETPEERAEKEAAIEEARQSVSFRQSMSHGYVASNAAINAVEAPSATIEEADDDDEEGKPEEEAAASAVEEEPVEDFGASNDVVVDDMEVLITSEAVVVTATPEPSAAAAAEIAAEAEAAASATFAATQTPGSAQKRQSIVQDYKERFEGIINQHTQAVQKAPWTAKNKKAAKY